MCNAASHFEQKNYYPVELSTTLLHHNYYICLCSLFYSGLGRDLLMYTCMSNQNDLQYLISYMSTLLCYHRATIDTSTNNPLYTSNCWLFAFLPSCSKHLELNVDSFLIQHKIALFSKLFGYYNCVTILPVVIQRM